LIYHQAPHVRAAKLPERQQATRDTINRPPKLGDQRLHFARLLREEVDKSATAPRVH
jgi:hypothetical protein